MLLLNPLLLAAAAAAFVIVPELSEADEDIFRALPIPENDVAIPMSSSIEVPCQKCHGPNTRLQMDFAVEGDKRLTLNGFELYPNADPWSGDLIATAVNDHGESKEQKLGYSLAVKPQGMDEDQHLELIDVDLRVIEVGKHFVDDISPVKVKLIKAASGEIIIASVELSQGGKDASDEPCTSMVCRFEKMFGNPWKLVKGGRKGCGGMRAHGKANGDRKHPHGRPGHKYDGHKKGGHHHHGSKGHRHSNNPLLKMFRNFLTYVFIPVLLGLTAGVTFVFVALLLGSIVYRLVSLVRGNRSDEADYSPKDVVVDATAADEEKFGLMVNQEPPPEYDEEQAQK